MKPANTIARILVGATLTGLLLWLAFRNQDLSAVIATVLHQPWEWFALLFVLNIVSHVLRAVRWTLLLEPVRPNIPVPAAFSALMTGFLVNGFIPRAGELVRCVLLGRRTGLPAETILSTVILERLLDMVSFAAVLCLVVVINPGVVILWFPFMNGHEYLLRSGAFALLAILLLLFVRASSVFSLLDSATRFIPERFRERYRRIVASFVEGFKAGGTRKNYLRIALLSASIWGMYIIILYLPLRLFGMVHLGIHAATVLQLMSGLASAMPVPNSVGSFHTFLAFMLTRGYGVAEGTALAYAVYTHGLYYLSIFFTGLAFAMREQWSWKQRS